MSLLWIEAHPGLASWVQGIGTFAAIIGAAFIAIGQTRAARRDAKRAAREALADKRATCALLLKAVSDFTGSFAQEMGDPAFLNALPHSDAVDRAIQTYADALGKFPLYDLADEMLVKFVLRALSSIGFIQATLENLRRKPSPAQLAAHVGTLSKAGASLAGDTHAFEARVAELNVER